MTTRQIPQTCQGPPWMGPLMPRSQYDRHWLLAYVLLLATGTVYFGWRGLLIVALTATMAIGVYALITLPTRIVRGRWPSAPLVYVLNMGLLMGLTLPVMADTSGVALAVRAGIAVGILSYIVGPRSFLRAHPVALAHLALILPLTVGEALPLGLEQVLTPSKVVVGDVWNADASSSGVTHWWQMSIQPADPDASVPTTPPADAVLRPNPDYLLLTEQKRMLANPLVIADLLRRGELARMTDVLIGARPGPIGLTSTIIVILLGLWLCYRRVGRWPMTLIALGAALAAIALMPSAGVGRAALSVQQFVDVGWQVSVAYIGYQLLATPLLPILLLMAPLTMPRSFAGRGLYAVIIGAGIVAARWFLPYEGIAYLPLVIAGLLSPLFDRLHRSPFVERTVR